MNKSQGTTTVAAIILAVGSLLRPSSQTTPPTANTVAHAAEKSATARATESGRDKEGPWRASCQYWAPARSGVSQSAATHSSAARNETAKGHTPAPPLSVSTDPAGSSCSGGSDQWGIPDSLPGSGGMAPEITAIIATVPDPERGHLELDFDRTIDALMQAASDNGYVGSYFWLPWKVRHESDFKNTTAEDSSNDEEDAERLKEPGLLVLKSVGANERDPGLSYRQVIYVFLVAATPTQGVDGEELRRAFEYEGYLLGKPETTLSMRTRSGQIPRDVVATIEEPVSQQKLLRSRQQRNPGPKQKVIGTPLTDANQQTVDEMDLILFNYSGSAASLREGIHAALGDVGRRHPLLSTKTIRTVSISGATSTELVGTLLNGRFSKTTISFHSFAQDTSVEEAEVTNLFQDRGSCDGIAFLAEDGTVFGSRSASSVYIRDSIHKSDPQLGKIEVSASHTMLSFCPKDNPLVLNFPRDISLLRNATAKEGEKGVVKADGSVAPYLHFSLKDSNAGDSVPHFSTDSTPLSQEAQLMSIGRYLVHAHIRTIAISASTILDRLFVAQFLHRACPDARIVFLGGGDLLIERDIDNLQYIGAITLSPYSLANLEHGLTTPRHVRAFADSQSESFYNAASFTFWGRDSPVPGLAGYPLYGPGKVLRPLLWATAVGRDGYSPLGIMNQCASSQELTLPDINVPRGDVAASLSPCTRVEDPTPPPPFEPGVRVYPSLPWYGLCALVILLCIGHTTVLSTANFWSPLTRDLAIESSDMPRRRTVYVNIASAMLFCLGFVVAYPIFPVIRASMWSLNAGLWAILTLVAAAISLIATAIRTLPHVGHFYESDECDETTGRQNRCDSVPSPNGIRRKNLYPLLHSIALLTLIAVPVLWVITCETDTTIGTRTYAGVFFSYRCLRPETGVSPILPIVLLLFSWYLWGVFHTLRLRSSVNGRPQLPCRVASDSAYPLYVAEEDLSRCDEPQNSCLYQNITCLLITRDIVRRSFLSAGVGVDTVLVLAYFLLFLICVLFVRVQSLDHFLWNVGFWPTLYEFMIRAMFFPLMVVALTGWIRIIFVWNSLRRGVLEPLERGPLRFAFTRLHGVAWMTMLRQGGLEEYWRDMARSTEAMRQMSHSFQIKAALGATSAAAQSSLTNAYDTLQDHLRSLVKLIGDKSPRRRRGDSATRPTSRQFLLGNDIPSPAYRGELNLMSALERDYAKFCELLLEGLLMPHWLNVRTGFVEGEPMEMMPIKAKRATVEARTASDALELHAAPHNGEEEHIRLAEEFLAIRYVAVIRSVLVNLRYLMIFISMAFVLATLTWNSYPFRPRQWVDWMFTLVLIVLGSGIAWVFAQMYRNPILSRITDTSANELGIEFYVRLATFGAVPLLTWLASQFPVIGNGIYHFLKPGLEVVK